MKISTSRRRHNDQSRGGLLLSQRIGGSDSHNEIDIGARWGIRWCTSKYGTSSSKKTSKERKSSFSSIPLLRPLEYLQLIKHPNIWQRDTYSKTGHLSTTFWLLILFCSLVVLVPYEVHLMLYASSTADSSSLLGFAPDDYHNTGENRIVFTRSLLFSDSATAVSKTFHPIGPIWDRSKRRDFPDYGSITYQSISTTIEGDNHKERLISPVDHIVYRRHRKELYEMMEEIESDVSISKEKAARMKPECRDVPWLQYKFPTCNTVHEMVIERAPSETNNHDVTYIRYVISCSGLYSCALGMSFPI
jgi:hypothetical protein